MGDLTFLFTDVVGSTTRWEDDPNAMAAAARAFATTASSSEVLAVLGG